MKLEHCVSRISNMSTNTGFDTTESTTVGRFIKYYIIRETKSIGEALRATGFDSSKMRMYYVED